ncbi:MAG: LytTR family DNA-binding domain-containing protein [Spirosomataceae bacterium]
MAAFELEYTAKGILGLRLPGFVGKVFVPLHEIVRLEGQRNYTRFVLSNRQQILVAKTLKCFEELHLPDFIRVSRSCIINRFYLTPYNGDSLRLKDGYEVPVSRRRVKDLESIRPAA